MVAVADRAGHVGMPPPRPRFAALVLSPTASGRSTTATRLRAAGASTVRAAATVDDVRAWGRAVGTQDVCVVEGCDEPGGPLAAAHELRTAGWRRLVVLGPPRDHFAARAALAHGVRAYLASPSADAGAPRVPPARPRGAAPDELSGREIQVLQHVADGRSNKDIGELLGLSALTVKSHLARIGRKLGTGDRAEMVARAFRTGLVR